MITIPYKTQLIDLEPRLATLETTLSNLPTSSSDPTLLPMSATDVNYENDNAVVKTVQTRSRELDDYITFLIDHRGDVYILQTTVISNTN
jgi:hypothetical protein